MISLHYAGELGPEPLAAAALATTLCNVTGLSFSVGLSSAITTLTGQARGHLLKRGHEMMKKKKRTTTTMMVVKKKKGEDENRDKKNIKGQPKRHQQSNHTQSSVLLEERKCERTPLLMMRVDSQDENDCDYDSTKEHRNNIDSDNELLLPLVFLYRGILIQLSIVIPIGIWWITGIEQTLLLLGQAQHLSQMTTIYLRVLTPGLWSYSINWTTTA